MNTAPKFLGMQASDQNDEDEMSKNPISEHDNNHKPLQNW